MKAFSLLQTKRKTKRRLEQSTAKYCYKLSIVRAWNSLKLVVWTDYYLFLQIYQSRYNLISSSLSESPFSAVLLHTFTVLLPLFVRPGSSSLFSYFTSIPSKLCVDHFNPRFELSRCLTLIPSGCRTFLDLTRSINAVVVLFFHIQLLFDRHSLAYSYSLLITVL